MTKEFINITAEANPGHASPSPGIIATVFVALFVESLVPVTMLVSDTHGITA
ncbi:MAG: hypothetical protein M3Q91_13530 [Acidobacteriota bacterium]|nr:hypothetical protein [Acidobacteriota bacterium]